MTLFQAIAIALLLLSSGAALSVGGRKAIIAVMWANLIATMTLATTPFSVGVADLLCATVLLFIGGKRAYSIAFLFAAMIPLYLIAPWLGSYATYSIVDVLAYAQFVILGGGGFGTFLRNLSFYTTIPSMRVHRNIHPMEEGHRPASSSKANLESYTVKGLRK